MMRKIFFVIWILVLCIFNQVNAQQRVINEIKKEISGNTVSIDKLKNSLKKLNIVLENDECNVKSEPWWLAGKIQYSIYDKMINNKASGEKIKSVDAGNALIDGYEKFLVALSKDTLLLYDKKGNPKIDKKTHKQKFKTKYSQDIMNKMVDHVVDYSAVAGDFYMAGDWSNAYKAWDIYCKLAKCDWAKSKNKVEADSVVGYNRFFQGLAASQEKKYDNASTCFAVASNLGYKNKALYDAWIDALMNLKDTVYMVSVAHEAHDRLGAKDPRYVRILINYYLKNRLYSGAQSLLDEAIKTDSTVAEYYDLKGRLIETQQGIDDALPLYKKAVELNPEFAMGLFDTGNAIYTKAINSNDYRSEGSKNLYNEALPYLEKAYKLMPENKDIKRILSRIYYVLGSDKIDEL